MLSIVTLELRAGSTRKKHCATCRQCAGRRNPVVFNIADLVRQAWVKCRRNFKSLCAGNAGEAENARGGKSASPARVIVHSTCCLHAASNDWRINASGGGPDFEAGSPCSCGRVNMTRSSTIAIAAFILVPTLAGCATSSDLCCGVSSGKHRRFRRT